jgi:hypothetical protein
MNVLVTILISGMLSTGALPQIPDDDSNSAQYTLSHSLFYALESTDNAETMVESDIWEQIMSGMSGSRDSQFFDVYIISGNDVTRAQKIDRLPINDHSYSINVPPASKILYVGKHIENGKVRYSMTGVVNKQDSWEYVSAVMKDQEIQLLKQSDNKTFSSLQSQ